MNKSTAKGRSRLTGFRWFLKLLPVLIVGIAIGVVAHWAFRPAQASSQEPASSSPQEQPGKQIAYWTCSMHPQVHMSKPGLCPYCNMKLIPVYKNDAGDEMAGMREFTTSKAAKALMDIETSPVERKSVTAEIRMVGKVEYDERRLSYITAWVSGRLDQLYVDYTGVSVNKGDHMVYMYSPELLSAQEELIQAMKSAQRIKSDNSDIVRELTTGTLEAAREKLRLLGLSTEQIAEVEKLGKASDHITIYAPISGIVVHKNALEGMYVNTGTRIYTVADLSHVWVKLDAYESDLSWLRLGQQVEFTTVSFPGEVFKGTISFIDPVLDPVTRTVKVRVDVPNKDGKLKPEMFVKALVKAESLGYVSTEPQDPKKPLVIPVTAALVTGTRAIVYVEVPNADKPTYEGREIVLGPRAGDYYIVRNGLEEGQRVVTKGNFKIDSALQIQAKPSMMTPEGGGSGGMHMNMDMGQGSKGKTSDEKKGQMTMALPAESHQQLNSVIAASDVVANAVKNSDLSQIQTAFAVLGKAIKAVDMKLLEGHIHTMWMEMSMRLDNDAVEGQQARTIEDAQRVAESLKTNISSLKSKFGLMQNSDTKVGGRQNG
jgi:Cu(I)/Ag(I) efflux system membrane fusion protein